MTSPAPSDDEADGDLGLGDGLKPGGLPVLSGNEPKLDRLNYHENCVSSTDTSFRKGMEDDKSTADIDDVDSGDESESEDESLSDFELTLLAIQPVQDLKNQFRSREPSKRSTETFPEEKKAFGNCLLDCDLKDANRNEFPIFADIPYGTSIRQQKELFNQNIEELKKKHLNGQDVNSQALNLRISGMYYSL